MTYIPCGAIAHRTGIPCKHWSYPKTGRCTFHGGLSTGSKTLKGRERQRQAKWRHGKRSAQAENESKEFRRLLGSAKKILFMIKERRDFLFPAELDVKLKGLRGLEDSMESVVKNFKYPSPKDLIAYYRYYIKELEIFHVRSIYTIEQMMPNKSRGRPYKRLHLRPVELTGSSLDGDAVIAGVDPERFSKTLTGELDNIIRAHVFLDKIEDMMFDEKFFNTMSLEEIVSLFRMVTYRKDSSQRYLPRMLEIAARHEILRKLFFEGIKEEDGRETQMSPVEKTVVMVLRNLILDRVKKGVRNESQG
jgi:hypothetical protein